MSLTAASNTLGKFLPSLFCGLALLAISSKTADASVADTVRLKASDYVQMGIIDTGPGFIKMLVISNVPFQITSSNFVGDIDIAVKLSGSVNGTKFGTHAQLPGEASLCSTALSFTKSKVYTSSKRTAARRGTKIQQAVQITARFDVVSSPQLSVESKPHTDHASRSAISRCSHPQPQA